ncbi:DUF4845 domain-containing protein [Vogesella sp. LYT5W]|uniref:DUF4845 domain-containing protein n=1 Tax=Vogesella margarita TaxID=2984199 RepID=A0ABT5IS91_9NEIS|nr:DUF4845 domain-containing protein [Vogesella margarita]MDC7715436.1 DUF4845 domain-containing protein [Vogesella margarita]
MKQQRGFSLLVVLALAIVLSVVLLGFFKLLPVYTEYFAIKKTIDEMAATPGKTDGELRREFRDRTTVHGIVSIKPEDLHILTTPNTVGIGVRYRREVPLVDHIGLILSFEHEAGTPVLESNP